MLGWGLLDGASDIRCLKHVIRSLLFMICGYFRRFDASSTLQSCNPQPSVGANQRRTNHITMAALSAVIEWNSCHLCPVTIGTNSLSLTWGVFEGMIPVFAHTWAVVNRVSKYLSARPYLPSTVKIQLIRISQLLKIVQWNVRTLLDRGTAWQYRKDVIF